MYLKLIKNNILFSIPSLYRRDFSTNMSKFKKDLKAANEVVVMSGAGISAESGIPTFQGDGALWRNIDANIIASPSTFRDDPGLVWEFYHYRRDLVFKAKPNDGHLAIAKFEAIHANDKKVTVMTQNVDGLHAKAGSKYVIELHGNIFKTRCTKCNEVLVNTDNPICEALKGRGSPTSDKLYSGIKVEDLPHCKRPTCGGLLRPHVVWFGESLDFALLEILEPVITRCDVLLLVGTSSIVFPAAAFPTVMAAGGSIVAEFNIEPPPEKSEFHYYFSGPASVMLSRALIED